MKKSGITLLALLTVAFVAAPVHAEWIAFDRAEKGAASIAVQGSAEQFTMTIALPGVEVLDVQGYKTVTIPEGSLKMGVTEPELPIVTTSIMLPDSGMPRVTVTNVEEVTLDVAGKILPSRGHLTRDVNIDEVPVVEGDVYKTDAFFPARTFLVEAGDPYILRDVRGCALRIVPVLYNPVAKKIRVAKKITLSVEMARGVSMNDKDRSRRAVCSEFMPVYRNLFANFGLATDKAAPDEEAGRAIVICPDEWLENLAPLQAWRAQKGFESKLVPVSAIAVADETKGLQGEDIKEAIRQEYEAGNLAFVMLVGDADRLPPMRGLKEYAHSDAMMVKLEGDDNYPDAFICRFSANTPEEVDVQVARAIAYDRDPVTGDAAAFYRKATGIASNEGNPKDWERANWLRDSELAWNYDVVDQIYDPSANAQMVKDAVNEGRGLINYIGHGSKTMWVSSRFNNGHVAECTNTDGKWPLIWSVACVNGDFARGTDCFGEAWAKAGTAEAPKGSIGIVAASTNMSWVPPCDWQSAIINDYMIAGKAFTGGALHYWGLVKSMEKWGDNDKSEGNKMVEQCIYFGDCSIMMRNDVPAKPEIKLVPAERGIKLAILRPGDEEATPVAHARVMVRTEEKGEGIAAVTGEAGLFEAELPAEATRLYVTVTGPNLVPVIDQVVELQ